MGTTEFRFWDVQHGHATYVRSPNGRHIVVDLGTGSYHRSQPGEFSPLMHLKRQYGLSYLDYMIITHPHRDHIDDILNFDTLIPNVLHRPGHLTRNDIIRSDIKEADLPKYEKYIEIDDGYRGGLTGQQKISKQNYGGLGIDTFLSTKCSTSNINNHSLITIFEYEGVKVVVPGDNESCSLTHLMDNPSFKRAVSNSDILLAPHHGRQAGFYRDFVKEVNHRITVVSDGRFSSTSFTSAYSDLSRGWKVHKRSGGSEKRNVITTRKDGVVSISIGRNQNRPFLEIKVD